MGHGIERISSWIGIDDRAQAAFLVAEFAYLLVWDMCRHQAATGWPDVVVEGVKRFTRCAFGPMPSLPLPASGAGREGRLP